MDIDSIENINLRHLARMKNAVEQYNKKSISLQSLIDDLEFISKTIDCIVEDDLVSLNNALMDLESVNSAQIEGENIPEMDKIISQSIKSCNEWISNIESKASK